MRVSDEELGKYYASLSDEALDEIDPADLTEGARKCYERELATRGPVFPTAPPDADESREEDAEQTVEVDPDWLETAASPCSFYGLDHAPDAARARAVLLDGGVPCHMMIVPRDPQKDAPSPQEYRLLVPEALNLKAISLLDLEIFNAQMEEDWRTHFAA